MGAPVNHKRMKPKAGAEPTAKERAHMDRVAQLPCLVSGERPVTLHHVTGSSFVMGRLPRNHQLVVPLAPRFHQAVYDDASNPQSVERLNHRGFFKKHNIDLLAEAEQLRSESIWMGIL